MSSKNKTGCGCAVVYKNTGVSGQQLFDVEVGQFLVPINALDGERNGIDTTANLETEILAKINHQDPSKRWYPIRELRNVTKETAEAPTETADDDTPFVLRDGLKTKNYEIWGASNQQFAKIKNVCFNYGIIEVDICGNIKGTKETPTATMLYPRLVNVHSRDARFMDRTNSAVSKIMVTYTYDRAEGDDLQWMIPASEFGVNKPNKLVGFLDVNLEVTALTATTYQIDATFDYGNAVNRNPWVGATDADFSVVNLDDPDPTIDSVVPDTNIEGRYVLTVAIPLPTTGDDIRIDAYKASTGVLVNGYVGESNIVQSL